MKKGFTLLEVMIAIIVGSLVMGVLVQSLWQLSKSIKQVSRVSSVDMRVSVFQNLLEKELASAFAPKLIPLKDDESEEKDDEKEKKEIDEHDEKDEESESTNKEKEQPLKKIFYTEHEGDNITLLTFITTSPLDVYNMSKPRVARIMYKMVPDKNNPELFELHRQESSSITDIKKFDSEATEGVKGFVVIDGIKSLKTTFLALPVKESKKESASPYVKKEDEKEKKEVQGTDEEKEEFVTVERWNVEDQKEQEDNGDDEGKKLPLIPNFIKMALVLFDLDQQEYTFEFTFAPMYGQKTVLLKGMKRIQPKKKKQEKKDPRADTIKNIMDKNPLSEGVQGKLDKWQKTAPPPPPPGPIMGGVR